MATQKIRMNIAASTFSLLSKESGRAIIIPAPAGSEAAVGMTEGTSTYYQQNKPQPLYIQNFLPTPQGLSSARVVTEPNPTIEIPSLAMRTNLYILRDELDTRVFYLADSRYNYIFDANNGEWQSYPVTIPPDKNAPTGQETITLAYIKSKTYVCVEGYGIYTYSADTNNFELVTIQGVNANLISGIVAAGTYLVLYDKDTIYWSNVNDPLDFVPSLITGAGSTQVLSVRSLITALAPVSDGFIIFTAHNAVFAQLTGDMLTPFLYKEITNFSGLPNLNSLSYGGVSDSLIAWTPTGILEVNSQNAIPSFPEATLFIQGKAVEEFDVPSDKLLLQATEDVLNSKFRVLSGRYVIISYSISTEVFFTHALVYDVSLKRWGKIAVDHIEIFEAAVPSPYRRIHCNEVPYPCNSLTPFYDYPSIPLKDRRCNSFTDVSLAYTDPAKTIGLLTPTGLIKTILLSTLENVDKAEDFGKYPPVAVFGDYALQRKPVTDIVSAEIDLVGEQAEVSFDTYIAYSDERIKTVPEVSPLDSHMYDMRITGKNHKLRVKGAAILSTIIVEAGTSGGR